MAFLSAKNPHREIVPTKRGVRPAQRHVYFVQGQITGLVKIGMAISPEYRLPTLQTGSPDRLTMLGVIPYDGADGMERDLHRRFAHLREHGEWFRAADELLTYIAENATAAPERYKSERDPANYAAADEGRAPLPRLPMEERLMIQRAVVERVARRRSSAKPTS